MTKERTRTYETRIEVETIVDEALHALGEYFSHIKHRLFADIAAGKEANALKNDYLACYQITARQFNALKVLVEGKIDSIKKRQPALILEKKERADSLESKIKRLEKNKADPKIVHYKKRRLNKLKKELHDLEEDRKKGIVRLCFGSKKLFRAQFDLEANGYSNHEEWHKDWQLSRSRELFFLGSKDEASGNQSCTATLEQDQTISLRLRIPDALSERFGKYIFIKDVKFSYGKQEIETALYNCAQRKSGLGQAISWRLIRDNKSWRAFATMNIELPPCTSNKESGVVGLDINADHLAIVETDRFGNPIHKKTIPFNLSNKNTHQARAIIGDAASQATSYAEKACKPLVIEDLDFQRKKTSLREECSASHARMLSSFSYQMILSHLQSSGSKKGVLVKQVNPAYTSLIGRVKFARRYGLTIHQAAALTIGRRFLGLSEKPPSCPGKIPDGKDGHVTLELPVRNRTKHVWSFWKELNKKLQVALKAHFRMVRIPIHEHYKNCS